MFSARTQWKLAPNRFTLALDQVRSSGAPLLDLTISNPTACGLQYDHDAILAAFHNPQCLSYDPQPRGLLPAREAVAAYYLHDHGATIDPQSLVLTTGTSEAYSFLFKLLCNPHDEILVPKPSYPLFEFLADLHDVRMVPYSLEYAHGWFTDFASVLKALTPQTRAVLLVHPNNPTGSYVREEEAARWNELCRARNLALIVDEVFLDYPFDGAAHKTFAPNRDALTFTLSGLSKIAALPQMKVAWIAASGPEQLVRDALDRLEVIADTYLSLSSPVQCAIPRLLEQRRSLQPELRQRTLENRRQLAASLAGQSRWQWLDAEGGWYAVLRLPAGLHDEEFAIDLLRNQNVVVHPGHFYDFPSDGFMVLSLITPTEPFAEGVRRLLTSSGA